MSDLISRQMAVDALERKKDKNAKGNIGSFYNKIIQNDIDTLMQLPSAQPEQRWIPCSERLPNCNGCYLVWRPHFFGGEIGMPAICYFDGSNTWHDSYGVDFERTLHPNDVTAWMPLPEPYREVGE